MCRSRSFNTISHDIVKHQIYSRPLNVFSQDFLNLDSFTSSRSSNIINNTRQDKEQRHVEWINKNPQRSTYTQMFRNNQNHSYSFWYIHFFDPVRFRHFSSLFLCLVQRNKKTIPSSFSSIKIIKYVIADIKISAKIRTANKWTPLNKVQQITIAILPKAVFLIVLKIPDNFTYFRA